MYYYVYQITNLINGKIYVGKHKSSGHPADNEYYGSGKQITAAIKKYGIENFKKEVLHFCSSMEEMSDKEADIVTEDFVKRKDTYNMHKGGPGGWDHINSDPFERARVSELSRESHKAANRGGTANWTEESWEKVRYQGWGAKRQRGELFETNSWAGLTEDEIKERKKKQSELVRGELNGSFGTHIYVPKNCEQLPPISVLNKNRFKEGYQPAGWVQVSEWRRQKKKNNGAKGRHWYNDGNENFFLFPDNEMANQLCKGRLNAPGNRFPSNKLSTNSV